MDIKEFPDEDKGGRYNTAEGLLRSVSGQLLTITDKAECANLVFEVVDLDGKRIDRVLIRRTSAGASTTISVP